MNARSEPSALQLSRALGWALITHFLFVMWSKFSGSAPEDAWWLSHVCLGLAGAGLAIDSPRLITAALIAVFGPHMIWLGDFAVLMAAGNSPWGVTAYFFEVSLSQQIATAHHFYLVPLLWVICARQVDIPRGSLLVASGAVVFLTLFSRAVLPESSNVNYAFAVLPNAHLTLTNWANALPTAAFLLLINAWVIGTMCIPTWGMLRGLHWLQKHRPAAACGAVDPEPGRALRAFTILECVVLLLILAVLTGVATPVYLDYRDRCYEQQDIADIDSINHALQLAYREHRAQGAIERLWIVQLDDAPRVLPGHRWPAELIITPRRIIDRRGFEYELEPETAESPAVLSVVVIPAALGQ